MTAIISAVSSLVSSAVGWITAFAKIIVGYVPANTSTSTPASWNPNILTLFVVLSLVGLGIGLMRRLMNVN